MIESIFIILGLALFFEALFEKEGFWDLFEKIGSKSNSKFVFSLLSCRFCMMFHITSLITIVFGLMNGFFWGLMVVPFVVNGFIHLKKK